MLCPTMTAWLSAIYFRQCVYLRTPRSKSLTASELQKQYHKSALVPLEVMQVCRRALGCIEKCKPYIYKYVASDGVIGADLLRTVIRNSVENVTANTSLIVDDNLRTRLDKEAESIVKGI